MFFRAFSPCGWNLGQMNTTIDPRLHRILAAQDFGLFQTANSLFDDTGYQMFGKCKRQISGKVARSD